MTLHSVLYGGAWVQRNAADMPCRKVLVAWYKGGIAEDEEGCFLPSEFSSHIECEKVDRTRFLIHGHYFKSLVGAAEDYRTRRV